MGLIRRIVQALALVALCVVSVLPGASASEIGSYAFQRTWDRTDQPVEDGHVNRTWVWGPTPFTGVLLEPYLQGNVSGQQAVRRVQYFDKSRMEITDSTADPNSDWYVTNGLLAKEMITGKMQTGDSSYVDYGPAQIDIAGDEGDPNAPTYASFTSLMGYQPLPQGWTITQTVDRQGQVGDDPTAAAFGVTSGHVVPESNHTIASVFWDFMTSSGTVSDGFQETSANLFSSPFFATGLPITEAYWTTVRLAGAPHRVLVQAFERRVLTFTPDNADGWKVEAGNVGRHYYEWRYGSHGTSTLSAGTVSASKDLNGNWVFLGNAKNSAKVAYTDVSVTVNLYAADNTVIATKTAYLDFSAIRPGETLPFRVWFESGPAYDHAETTVTGRLDPSVPPAALSFVVLLSNYTANGGYHVQAVVRNDSSQAIRRPSYIVALYQPDGQIIDYDAGFLALGTLDPGASTTIDVTFYKPSARFSHYRAFASN